MSISYVDLGVCIYLRHSSVGVSQCISESVYTIRLLPSFIYLPVPRYIHTYLLPEL